MYTAINKDIKLAEEDTNFIATIQDKSLAATITALITSVIDTNGSAELITPGLGKQYIDTTQFYQMIDEAAYVSEYKASIGFVRTLERALNWNALGRGKGGIAGAAVREAYRKRVNPARECTFVKGDPASFASLLKDFLDEMEAHKSIYAFWKANADNVIGVAAAVMLKVGHHWDAQNTRPQRAVLAALDQRDVFSDTDLRKLFYLAIHPIPLPDLMSYIERGLSNPALNEAVKCRLKAPPAGTAGFVIASSAVSNIKAEEFYKYASDGFKGDLAKIEDVALRIHANPLQHHTMAPLLTSHPKIDIPTVSPEALGLCIAYVKVCIKGSLANAPSLMKLSDSYARIVTRYSAALDQYVEKRGADVAQMISAGEHSYKSIEKKELREDMVADAQARAIATGASRGDNV